MKTHSVTPSVPQVFSCIWFSLCGPAFMAPRCLRVALPCSCLPVYSSLFWSIWAWTSLHPTAFTRNLLVAKSCFLMFCVKISVDLGYRRLPEGEVMGRAAKQNVIASPPRIKGHIHTYICFFFLPLSCFV